MLILITNISILLLLIHVAYSTYNKVTKKTIDESIEPDTTQELVIDTDVVIPVANTMYTRNKNILGITAKTSNYWKGQIGLDNKHFAKFSEYQYSIRAASIIIMKYYRDYNIDTIRGLVTKYSHNKHNEYIKFLCSNLGVKPDTKLNFKERLADLLKAMAKFETGQTFPDTWFIAYE